VNSKLSIIVPLFNEEKTIVKVLEAIIIARLGITKEVIVVDDGSVDNSVERVREFIRSRKKGNERIKLIKKQNQGKGSAVRKGFSEATGDLTIVQDADLEYNPDDIRILLAQNHKQNKEVIYGSRMIGENNGFAHLSFYLGNLFLSSVTSLLFKSRITDMETCYKLIPKKVIDKMVLNANGFDIEPEITTQLMLLGYMIKEVPISYRPRTREEGKKIKWVDGVKALWLLIQASLKKKSSSF
jgi:dolichol-phosphate mannosyltransferase